MKDWKISDDWVYVYRGENVYEVEIKNSNEEYTSFEIIGLYSNIEESKEKVFEILESPQNENFSVNLNVWFWNERDLEYSFDYGYENIMSESTFEREMLKFAQKAIEEGDYYDSIRDYYIGNIDEIESEFLDKLINMEFFFEKSPSKKRKNKNLISSILKEYYEGYKKSIEV